MVEVTDGEEAPTIAKKTKPIPKTRKPKVHSHPKVSEMVTEAISNLNEREGSSVQAIKKYMADNFDVDLDKLSPFIKKYLRSAAASGGLVQTKGKGATGSFKIAGVAPSSTTKRSEKIQAARSRIEARIEKVEKVQKVKSETALKSSAKPVKASVSKKATHVKKAKPAAKKATKAKSGKAKKKAKSAKKHKK